MERRRERDGERDGEREGERDRVEKDTHTHTEREVMRGE